MLTWVIVFVVFSIMILIHEAGHLFAAKRAGIVVEADDVRVLGCDVVNWVNGVTTSAKYTQVIGNRIHDTQAPKTQQYPLVFWATSAQGVATANVFVGNLHDAVYDAGTANVIHLNVP